jgi:hypothetical protein
MKQDNKMGVKRVTKPITVNSATEDDKKLQTKIKDVVKTMRIP